LFTDFDRYFRIFKFEFEKLQVSKVQGLSKMRSNKALISVDKPQFFQEKTTWSFKKGSSAEVGVQELSPNISPLTADQHTSCHIFHLSLMTERRQLIFLVINGSSSNRGRDKFRKLLSS
jgi:hypothetical protein